MIWIPVGAFALTAVLAVFALWHLAPRATRIDYTPLSDETVSRLDGDGGRRWLS